MAKFIVGVTFATNYNHKVYNFLSDIKDLVPGDQVVVDTVNGLQLATVDSVRPEEESFGEEFGSKKQKWVVQKIDLTAHNARREAEEKALVIRKKMEERRKKAQELEIYAILAKEDPEMAAMLEDYKKLQEVL